MKKTSTLPRNGQYEIFSNAGRTYCFDDPGFVWMYTPEGMFEWIREQDPALWTDMTQLHGWRDDNSAFYLQPKLYLLWKLRWV